MRRHVLPLHRHVRLNSVDVHIAEQGEGPLVLLLHGFPEAWYSWRHQIDAIAAAGYRVVAPDQRGYGTTDRPDGIDQHSIFHLVGDVAALIREFGEEQAVVEQCFGAGFYQNYFQEPGVADADLGRDVAAALRPDLRCRPQSRALGRVPRPVRRTRDAAVLAHRGRPGHLRRPVQAAGGFTGGLNWYRNLDRNGELTAAWQDAPITPPSL
ncbi:alpha/beta fold hydrolase [Streptomyces sp. NPDC002586]